MVGVTGGMVDGVLRQGVGVAQEVRVEERKAEAERLLLQGIQQTQVE